MKKTSTKSRMSYETEADVLSWEITGRPIDHATEVGNVVVHFTKDNSPVLIEILEASKFLGKIKDVVRARGSAKRVALAAR